MKITLELTKDHLKLIPFILIKDNNDENLEIDKTVMLMIQSTLVEDVSMILGLRDKAIPNTEFNANGRAFPEEITKYIFDIYNYVKENLYYIETLIHQFVIIGGITEGIYEADSKELWWKKIS